MQFFRSLKTRYAPQGSFVSHVITLMTGTTIAQVISLGVSPVLTRFYHPEDFGVFALFMGIGTLVSVAAAGRYEYAIVLPEHEDDATNVLALSILLVLIVSLLSFPVIIIITQTCKAFVDCKKYVDWWIWFIPGYVLVTGIYQCLNLWNNRLKRFNYLSISRIVLTIATAITALLFGYFSWGAKGLIFSAILGQAAATATLCWYTYKEQKIKVSYITVDKIKALAIRYSDFPKINVLHTVIDNLNATGTIIVITYYFGAAVVGYYSFMMRIVQAPSSLISSSLMQVFYQRAAEAYAGGESLVTLINKLIRRLALLVLVPAVILLLAGPQIFGFVFGDKWQPAGTYAQLLTPYMCMYFIIAPLALVPFIVNKQKAGLLVSSIGNALFLSCIYLGGALLNDIRASLLFCSMVAVFYCIFYVRWIRFISVHSVFQCKGGEV